MSTAVRTITDDEVERFTESFATHFGLEVREGASESVRSLIGIDRCHVALDGDTIAGTAAAYGFELTVPGATLATAGLSKVGVSPTHRRRGILTKLMSAHFADAIERGEVLSALWASEAAIYGRFGYGMAMPHCEIVFDSRTANIRSPEQPDRIRFVEPDEARQLLPKIHELTRSEIPGQIHRSTQWWERRHFRDFEWMRQGKSKRRTVIAERDGKALGYATYRQKENWDELGIPGGEVLVAELHGVDLLARHSLWWFLANIDLFPKVKADAARPDSILPWLATNYRAIDQRLSDGIWLRILDVEKALSGRRYETTASHTFELIDKHVPANAGFYRLDTSTDGATCQKVDGKTGSKVGSKTGDKTNSGADVVLTAAGLGSLFFGTNQGNHLLASGAATGDPEAIATMTRSFGWPVAAWCNESF